MTFKTKFVFKEKSLNSEVLEDSYLQVLQDDDTLYILLMSELPLSKNKPLEYTILRNEGMVSFYNKGNDIDKLTETSFEDLLTNEDDDKELESVINYEINDDEINELDKMIRNSKEVKVVNFVIKDLSTLISKLENDSFELMDGNEYIEKIASEYQSYGINETKSKDTLKKISYDLAIETNCVTPFYFISDIKQLKDVRNIKHPKEIKEINTFNL